MNKIYNISAKAILKLRITKNKNIFLTKLFLKQLSVEVTRCIINVEHLYTSVSLLNRGNYRASIETLDEKKYFAKKSWYYVRAVLRRKNVFRIDLIQLKQLYVLRGVAINCTCRNLIYL